MDKADNVHKVCALFNVWIMYFFILLCGMDKFKDFFSHQCLNGIIAQPRFIFKCLYCEFSSLCKYCTMSPFIALLEYFLNKDFLLNSLSHGNGCMF